MRLAFRVPGWSPPPRGVTRPRRARTLRLGLGALALVVIGSARAGAQEVQPETRPVRWSASVAPARGDAPLRVRLSARIADAWKLYSLTQPAGGPAATSIAIVPGAPFHAAGEVVAPPPEAYADRNFGIWSEIYERGVRFALPVRATPGAPDGPATLRVAVRWQACTDRYCLPPASETLAVPLAVQAGRAIAATAMSLAAASPAARAPALAPTQPAAPGSAASVPAPRPTAAPAVEGARPVSIRSTDRAAQLRFLALAAGMGLLALLTPCILPLVPITVSFLSRDGDAPRARGRWVRPASYATGIVLTFTVLGALVSALLGAGGMVRLAASPVVNVSIALLFVAFGANLLGLWALRLPAGLATRLLRVGATGEGGALSVATAFLMGVAFAVTSFTCTAPFVGSLLVLAAQGERSWPLAGLAVYALAFALPFVILAGVPRLFRWLPRSGPWMVTLEGVLGIVEIAMAVKFLSNADLVLGWGVLRREVVIALWIAALALVALVLAGIVPLPGAGRPARRAPGRVLAAVPVVGALWLATGLRGARLGEIEAYLPPLDAGMHAASTSMLGAEPSVRDDELPWRRDDYEGALAQATREGRPLLVDFTGYTCTNCRWMEANMFPRPAVRAQLERFVRVRLYTDGLGEPYARQQAMQQARFGTVALPYYAVLAPDGTPRATFLGMTRDTREFVGFLTRWSSR